MKPPRRGSRLAAVVGGAAPGAALTAAWTFPAMIGAAFLVAWAAEAAEFLFSQGLALAVLALIQTMPEFAVEAVIAWKAGKDPNMVHLAIANFTGSLRLLTGFGWPMIYAVAALSSRKKRGRGLGSIRFADDHAVEIVGLLPPLAYFVIVWAKASLSRRARRSRRSRAGPSPSAARSGGWRSGGSSSSAARSSCWSPSRS